MTIREIKATVNMAGFGIPNPISGVLFGGEDQAHKFIISNQDGAAFSGTVSAKFLRYADNATVPLTGSIEAGKATVTLIENCYAWPGRFKLTVYVTEGASTTAVYCCMGTVDRTDGERTIDPSGEINLDVTDLINRINAARASVPADYTALLATIAPTFSASAAYNAGEYVWYDGALYRYKLDHAAGDWTWNDVEMAVVGDSINNLENLVWQYNKENSLNLFSGMRINGGTQSGITCTDNGDGSVTVSGTNLSANDVLFFWVYDSVIPDDLVRGGHYRCQIDSSIVDLGFLWYSSINPNVGVRSDIGTGTFIAHVPETAYYCAIYLRVPAGATVNEIVHPVIYVPIGTSVIWQYVEPNSKNVLPTLDSPAMTSGGVTCVDNGDGSYTISGTNTGSENALFFFLHNSEFSGLLENGGRYLGSIDSDNIYLAFFWYDSEFSPIFENAFTRNFVVTVPENAVYVAIYMLVPPGATVNATVHPSLLVPISMSTKVDVSQGVAHAGQALIVDDNGNVTTGEAGAPVDPTLSITGYAADAKVTGDEIAELKSAVGDLDDLETADKTSLVAAINEAASGASVAGDVADLQAAVFHEAGTSMANTTYSGTATANTMWGFNLPGITAGKIVVKPKFNTESGTYTAKRWRPTQGDLENNAIVEEIELKTANIGQAVYFEDVTENDFFSFLSSSTTDKLYYCNNNAQQYNVPLGKVALVDGTSSYKYTLQPLYFAALQLDIVEKESNFILKLDKNQGIENAGKLMKVGDDGEVEPVEVNIPAVDNTLRIAGAAAGSKTVGDILLDQPIGPELVWTKDKFFNATTGEIITSTKCAITEPFLSVAELRTLYLAINYPETPGYLSAYWQILTYQADGTYVGYEQYNFNNTNQVRVLMPGYKYRFAMNYGNAGTFTFDEILGMIAYHWKEPLPDQIGLVTKVGTLEDGMTLVDQLDTEVNGGGEKISFFIEKGDISTSTGADGESSSSSIAGRSIGYYESDGDPIIISVPVGGRCLVYEYSGESSNDFIRTISPATTDGITYVSSPYTLVTTSGYFYRFTFMLNNDYTWQDGQEFFKDFTFVLQSTAVEGLEKRVTALEQASGSDKIFTGKTCVTLGDSITYRNVWQPVVSDALGMTMINKGIGSTCLGGENDSSAMCSTTRLNGVLAESPDYVTILGGANDLTTNMAIGTEAEFSKALAQKDRDTFVGAYSYIVEYLLGQDPTLSIMILGTTWAHNDGARYSETKTYTDYSDASRMVAQYYGLPFVDLHGECGFNAFTMGSAVANQIYSSDQIHPNAEGGKRIASLVIAKMIEAWKYTV